MSVGKNDAPQGPYTMIMVLPKIGISTGITGKRKLIRVIRNPNKRRGRRPSRMGLELISVGMVLRNGSVNIKVYHGILLREVPAVRIHLSIPFITYLVCLWSLFLGDPLGHCSSG